MMRHEQGNLSEVNHYSIHALIAAYFNIISKFYRMTAFSRHIDGVSPSGRMSSLSPSVSLGDLQS